jgi:thiamine-monophosphate kinase
MDEFSLIQRYFSRHARAGHEGVVLGVGDDAAVLRPSPGHDLVMATDTLVSGRHFPADMAAFDIGWRSLAVNLSDLAAMGARPLWFLLSVTLPEADEAWLAGFAQGMFDLADRAGIALVGGDVTRGPLSVSIQATGRVPRGQAVRRDGARPGQRLAIGGVPGQGGLGLRHWQAGERATVSARHLARPAFPLDLGAALVGRAGAAIDVSDGLLQDLGHILKASGGLGAELDLATLPVNEELAALDEADRYPLQLTGGDDYCLLFTWPDARPLPPGTSDIGMVTEAGPILLRYPDGRTEPAKPGGWRHF